MCRQLNKCAKKTQDYHIQPVPRFDTLIILCVMKNSYINAEFHWDRQFMFTVITRSNVSQIGRELGHTSGDMLHLQFTSGDHQFLIVVNNSPRSQWNAVLAWYAYLIKNYESDKLRMLILFFFAEIYYRFEKRMVLENASTR